MIALDEEQQIVVNREGSVVCVAGPGSGKTRVLTEKARRLFDEGKDVLCLTFTRSAAREMQERVPGLPASTIHSYCYGTVGWKEKWSYSGLLYRFLIEKDIYRYDHVLVDEVQDLNEMEMDVVLALIGGEIFAVGDPYQSIYGFQGAMGPRVMPLLERCGCKALELRNNYRSCPEVVDRLNSWYNRGLVSRETRSNGLTAILCRKNDDLFEVSEFLKGMDIAHRVQLAASVSEGKLREWDVLRESNLRLMTIHAAKGHEFDYTILFGWYPDRSEEEEDRVYYVAMSRASKKFTEVGSLSELSKIIKEII